MLVQPTLVERRKVVIEEQKKKKEKKQSMCSKQQSWTKPISAMCIYRWKDQTNQIPKRPNNSRYKPRPEPLVILVLSFSFLLLPLPREGKENQKHRRQSENKSRSKRVSERKRWRWPDQASWTWRSTHHGVPEASTASKNWSRSAKAHMGISLSFELFFF